MYSKIPEKYMNSEYIAWQKPVPSIFLTTVISAFQIMFWLCRWEAVCIFAFISRETTEGGREEVEETAAKNNGNVSILVKYLEY